MLATTRESRDFNLHCGVNRGVVVQPILRTGTRLRRSAPATGYPMARPVGAASPREAAHAKDRNLTERRHQVSVDHYTVWLTDGEASEPCLGCSIPGQR